MKRSKTHALAWADAVRDSDVSRNARAVALACLTFADYGTGANMRAGVALIGRCSGLAERATRYAIHELLEAGLLVWDGKATAPGITRTYSLTIPKRRHGDATERRHGDATTVAPIAPNGGTSVQPTKAYQGRPKARRFGGTPEAAADAANHKTAERQLKPFLKLGKAELTQLDDGSGWGWEIENGHGYMVQADISNEGEIEAVALHIDTRDMSGLPLTIDDAAQDAPHLEPVLRAIHTRDGYMIVFGGRLNHRAQQLADYCERLIARNRAAA